MTVTMSAIELMPMALMFAILTLANSYHQFKCSAPTSDLGAQFHVVGLSGHVVELRDMCVSVLCGVA
jgi:hypothetical protein